jgi:hypothetical protein
MAKKSSSSERKQEEAVGVLADKMASTASTSSSDNVVVSTRQIKCLMFGVAIIVFMNLVLTVVALVVGLQVKSEVEGIEAELEPIMELASSLEAITGGDGGMPTTP